MAAMLSNAPQLLAYRELLHHSRELQSTLSLRSCIQDPSSALEKGILEPLETLYRGSYRFYYIVVVWCSVKYSSCLIWSVWCNFILFFPQRGSCTQRGRGLLYWLMVWMRQSSIDQTTATHWHPFCHETSRNFLPGWRSLPLCEPVSRYTKKNDLNQTTNVQCSSEFIYGTL